MVSFDSDYIAGAHPAVLKKLEETNLECLPGYGTDKYCDSAKEKIKSAIGVENLDAEFITGGTQTNSIVISTMLADYEAVIAAKTGHISVHEAASVEYSGHKVIELEQKDGKISAEVLNKYASNFYADPTWEHMAIPGMVYISHPTEYGTLYTKKELEDISEVCHKYEMPLFIDGARLGYGLMSRDTDVSIADIARLCDVFYIGGTKVGALCGEAVVFTKNNKPKHFTASVKRRGALLAKGRLLGVQFDALFTDDLYFKIGKYAIDMAEKMKEIFTAHGIKFFLNSPTNQQFVIMENTMIEKLQENIVFSFWEKYDDSHSVVRFVTSWSTTDEDLKVLEEEMSKFA